MEELQRIIEAEVLFMDALGGEFRPRLEPTRTRSLARVTQNMLAELSERPMKYDGNLPESIDKEVDWAPARAYLYCAPFEMRSFGRYGQRGQALLIPIGLSFSIEGEGFGVKALKFEFFHPAIFSPDIQPSGPEGRFEKGGYLEVSATLWGGEPGKFETDSIHNKIGLSNIEHCFKARRAVMEIVKQAF